MATVPPVQARSTTVGFASGITLAFSTNNTAGNFIAVGAHNKGGVTGDRASDSRNTYGTDVVDLANGASVGLLQSAPNIGAGANTVSVSGAGSSNGRGLCIAEYAGVATVSPLDKVASATGDSTALASGNTAALTQAINLVVCFGFNGTGGGSGPYTAGSSLTKELDENAGTLPCVLGDKETASAAATSGSFTGNGTGLWGCIVGVYKAATAAPTRGSSLLMCGVGN